MNRNSLSDDEWEKIQVYLIEHPHLYIGKEQACRCFLDAVLWILRSGSQWRLLPAEKGKWNSVFKRYSRWSRQGVWEGLLNYVSQDADLQELMIDSTVVRAHACAAGAKKTARPSNKH
jgi:transposase